MKQLALVAMCVVACGREGSQDTHRAPAADSAVAAPSAFPDIAPDCPATGQWQVCSLVNRLDRAGLVPRLDSAPASEAPLTAKGSLVRVGNGELELYVYPDTVTRVRDERSLDRDKYLAPYASQKMQPLPTLIVSANVIAVLHSRNDHLRERVADAITAGPPQPPTPLTP